MRKEVAVEVEVGAAEEASIEAGLIEEDMIAAALANVNLETPVLLHPEGDRLFEDRRLVETLTPISQAVVVDAGLMVVADLHQDQCPVLDLLRGGKMLPAHLGQLLCRLGQLHRRGARQLQIHREGGLDLLAYHPLDLRADQNLHVHGRLEDGPDGYRALLLTAAAEALHQDGVKDVLTLAHHQDLDPQTGDEVAAEGEVVAVGQDGIDLLHIRQMIAETDELTLSGVALPAMIAA